jgi:hypothetical protein
MSLSNLAANEYPSIPWRLKRSFGARDWLVGIRGPRNWTPQPCPAELATTPVILPPQPNMTRTALDGACATAGLSPNVVMEADVVSNILSSICAGIVSSVLPKGDLTDLSGSDLAKPIMIDPSLYLTCYLISSTIFPLTAAGEAVRDLFATFVERHLRERQLPALSGWQNRQEYCYARLPRCSLAMRSSISAESARTDRFGRRTRNRPRQRRVS